MKVKGELLRRWKGTGKEVKEEGRIRKHNRGGKYDQSTIYVYMKVPW
jgi:hypothetical protein